MSYIARKKIVTNNLVFSVDPGNKLCDNIANVRNMVNPLETGAFINGASVVDDAYSLDGINQRVEYTEQMEALNFEATEGFAIDTYMAVDNLSSSHLLFGRNDGVSNQWRGYQLVITSTGGLYFGLYSDLSQNAPGTTRYRVDARSPVGLITINTCRS